MAALLKRKSKDSGAEADTASEPTAVEAVGPPPDPLPPADDPRVANIKAKLALAQMQGRAKVVEALEFELSRL